MAPRRRFTDEHIAFIHDQKRKGIMESELIRNFEEKFGLTIRSGTLSFLAHRKLNGETSESAFKKPIKKEKKTMNRTSIIDSIETLKSRILEIEAEKKEILNQLIEANRQINEMVNGVPAETPLDYGSSSRIAQ